MRIRLLPAAICLLCVFKSAPGGSRDQMEQDLRARAGRFYQLQVAGGFREAEKLVCRDSRDAFYAVEKRAYRSASISSVVVSQESNSAEVVALLEGEFAVGIERQVMTAPVPSHWRHEKQGWCVELASPGSRNRGPIVVESPMGPMVLGTAQPGSTAQPPVGLKTEAVAGLASGVTFSKDTLRLKRQFRSEDSIEIHNGLPGAVQIELDCPLLASFVCTIDHAEIQAGGIARFSVAYDPSKAKSGEHPGRRLFLIVQPFGRTKEIAILLE